MILGSDFASRGNDGAQEYEMGEGEATRSRHPGEDDHRRELCRRADYFGMDSLTEDEQFLVLGEQEDEMDWKPTIPEVKPGETVYELRTRQGMTVLDIGQGEFEGKAKCRAVNWQMFEVKKLVPGTMNQWVTDRWDDGCRWVPIAWIKAGCSSTQPPMPKTKKAESGQAKFDMPELDRPEWSQSA